MKIKLFFLIVIIIFIYILTNPDLWLWVSVEGLFRPSTDAYKRCWRIGCKHPILQQRFNHKFNSGVGNDDLCANHHFQPTNLNILPGNIIKPISSENCAKYYDKYERFNNMNNKYVCLYAYYEKNKQYKNNLIYFLNNGGILDYVDYYIIINGNCSVDIPDNKNIKIIRRTNEGFDFGAWSHVIQNYLIKSESKSYDYYIFINSSVEGPHISKNNLNKNWLDLFLELFINDDVKMVGSTINILENPWRIIKNFKKPYTHIQSMFFILDRDAFIYLNNFNFFDEKKLNKMLNIEDIIFGYEIKLSMLILKNNWNINCIVPHYRNLDYRNIKHNINTTGSDVLFKNSFFGNTLKPEDVIFYKGYRFYM